MKIIRTLVVASFAASATPALAQSASLGELLAQGFEVKAMTSNDLNPTDNEPYASIFIIVQKEGEAYGCVLRSITSSNCQRIQ